MLLFVLACVPHTPETTVEPIDVEVIAREQPNIFVDKSEERLYLVRNGELVEEPNGGWVSWPVSFGQGVDEGDKEQEGDKRTPEGLYVYSDYSSSSKYHGSLLIHYPSPEDAERAFSESRIDANIKNEILRSAKNQNPPPMLTGMGGYILVHGTHKNGEVFPSNIRYLWTDGCVGMSNDDIDALRVALMEDAAVAKGTILIVP